MTSVSLPPTPGGEAAVECCVKRSFRRANQGRHMEVRKPQESRLTRDCRMAHA
jgi:hypothetical protein